MKTTQREAREAGDIYYNTGKPCVHGHHSAKYTVSGNCVDCKTEKRAMAPKKPRNGLLSFNAMLTPEWYAAFKAAWDTVTMGTDSERHTLMGNMTESSGLTLSDAIALGINLQPGHEISGHSDARDGGDEMHLRIGRKWYSEVALIELMTQAVTSIKEIG